MSLKAAKASFFDTEEVQKKLDAKMIRVLSRFGAFVRRRDQTSIRYRKGASSPGGPPSAHRSMGVTKTNRKTGAVKTQTVSPLRNFIMFAYEESGGKPGVVIGPVALNGHAGPAALKAIEEGGTETLRDRKGQTYTARYKARPHTGPAFREEIQRTLPGLLGS